MGHSQQGHTFLFRLVTTAGLLSVAGPALSFSAWGQAASMPAPEVKASTSPSTDSSSNPGPASLPDAPSPSEDSASYLPGLDTLRTTGPLEPGEIRAATPGYVPVSQCPEDTTHAHSCRVHWHQLVISSAVFNGFQNAGNLYTGYWYRWETTHGPWFQRWFDSVTEWKWDRWSDDNPAMDDYVGHPMMGSITNYLWIQNDPKGMTVPFGNTRAYWHSRMRALAFSTAYSFEWKFGPFGEAGVGHNGDHFYFDNGKLTNETGVVELVTTPVGGFLWTVAEDALDKHVVRKFEEKPHNPFSLLMISFLTPSRATANIFRFRPPWYRDDRTVKAASFWSVPEPSDDLAGRTQAEEDAEAEGAEPAEETGVVSTATGHETREPLPEWEQYGGVHEFGAWWGLSLMSGHIWGYAKDVKYMPIDITYSYLLHQGKGWSFRYAPELTALAMLDEPQTGKNNIYNERKRTYGSGLSPVGFKSYFFPESRVQPYFSTDGGFIYFDDRVLSPQGSQWMYTIDYGTGLTIFRKKRESISIGYRYQHLSNANISHHNPGTDTNTFYLQVSRYRTKHYR